MARRLIYSVLIGLIVAVLLLAFFPALRLQNSLPLTSLSQQPQSFYKAVALASPAVVYVYSAKYVNGQSNNLQIESIGSGVIMNTQGYILTNKHVINHADQVIVFLTNQSQNAFEATIVGSDQLTDLAVLKINTKNLSHIPHIKINLKRSPHVGDIVLAIGNPFNLGQTITQGIISAIGRNGLSPTGRQHFLQTDASINHGNSGGALINTLGELVGINTLSLDKSNSGNVPEGLGFAIPTSLAVKIMDKIIRDGRVIRGYIGISGREIIPFSPQQGTKDKKNQGIIVINVNNDGPAAQAGIKPNDIILYVNHRLAVSALETMDQIAEISPGTTIPIELVRDGKLLTINVKVIEYPNDG